MSTPLLERMLSVRELAQQLECSEGAVYYLVNHPNPEERIPHMRVGGRIRFLPSVIREWQLEGHRKSIASHAPPQRTREEERAALGLVGKPKFG